MACESPLIYLPCDMSGQARTATAINPNDTVIQLMNGMGSRFPQVPNGKWFYIKVVGCDNCCEAMRVVARDGDKLHVQRGFGTQCTCIKSNAPVVYTTDTPYFHEDLLSKLPLNVAEPLRFNCETNTLSVDCSKLFSNKCGGCGCEGSSDSAAAENGTPANAGAGLRGPKGDTGEPGTGIQSITITATKRMMVTLTDGRVIDAGMVPTTAGPAGERGQKGDTGDKGEKGDAGVSIGTFTLRDGILIATMTDGSEQQMGNVVGPQGVQGPPGPQGEQGADGYTFSYVEDSSSGYLSGRPNAQVQLVLMTQQGETPAGTFNIPAGGLLKMLKLNVTGRTVVALRVNGVTMGLATAGG